MDANTLYNQLEKDFIKPGMDDDWSRETQDITDFLSENFKERSMGVVCDFATEITQVYTAVFPSEQVLRKILETDARDALLFVHHPAVWDIRKAPNVFSPMDRGLLQTFKERNIAIYNLHVLLDNYGPYSTSVTLARALGITAENAFAPYHGSLCGVIGKTEAATIMQLKEQVRKAVGHEIAVYAYGNESIADNTVALVAGGGNDEDVLRELVSQRIFTFITGITAKSKHSQKAHAFAKIHGINIIGATHYSTEKFACMKMVEYFAEKGLPATFIEDTPVMEDM